MHGPVVVANTSVSQQAMVQCKFVVAPSRFLTGAKVAAGLQV